MPILDSPWLDPQKTQSYWIVSENRDRDCFWVKRIYHNVCIGLKETIRAMT